MYVAPWDASKTEIVLGPPGTGKTEDMIRTVQRVLREGVNPEKIAFVSFTKKAALEARNRAKDSLDPEKMKWFRTVHSLAYSQIGARRDRMMTGGILREYMKKTPYDFRGEQPDDDTMCLRSNDGDVLVFLENYARVTQTPLAEVWKQRNATHYDRITFQDLAWFADSFKKFKLKMGLLDFTDTLEQFVANGFPPNIDVLIVDEAQDLSRLQWAAVRKIASRAKRVYIAGDDDQAIYRWAGADVETFLNLEGTTRVLGHSYRLPRRVYERAVKIRERISRRRTKDFEPRDADGEVQTIDGPYDLDASSGKWLLLARHGYQIEALEEACRHKGWFYESRGEASNRSPVLRAVIAWENLRSPKGNAQPTEDVMRAAKLAGLSLPPELRDMPSLDREAFHPDLLAKPWFDVLKVPTDEANYFRRALARGEKPISAPRIQISTIHGAKGGQADGVFLTSDVSESTFASMQRDGDDESRVFYVGVTRAREKLVLKRPETGAYYPVGE